jgi:hypothetical protein
VQVLDGTSKTCTPDGHLHTVTYTKCRINTIDSPDDEHWGAQNMQRTGINIYEKRILRQVGYLQEMMRLRGVFLRVCEHA